MHYIDLSPKDPIAAGRRKIIPSQKTDAAAGNPGRSKFIVYDVNGAVRRSRARIWRRTALLSAEIDDITRFGNPKKLVSWAGMCPTLHQSGGTSYHGRMKKDSNRKVNWIMIQCAHVAAMHDDRMKAYYERIKKRQRPSVAITHVANKMLIIIWHMLTKNELYRGRNENLYRSKIKKVMAIQ